MVLYYQLSVLLPLYLILSISSAAEDDSFIMARLSAAFNPAPSDWTGKSYCNWSGITCDTSNYVTSINLPYKSLSGALPYEISSLSQLRTIDLRGNSLSGPLPSFSSMFFLQHIFLDSNDFLSAPRVFVYDLPNLKTFSIGDTFLSTWDFPETLFGSRNLEILYASNTGISGNLPDSFDLLPHLKNLNLSHNDIYGPLPQTFRGSKIQNLWLSGQNVTGTGLHGTLDVLSSMSHLSQVWLDSNSLTGPLPDLSNCTNLFDLQLHDNQLTGVLPPSIMDLPKLINISLHNNKLQGEFPVFKPGVKASIGNTNSFCLNTPGPCDPQVTVLLAIAACFGYPLSLAEAWTGNDACDQWKFVTCDSHGKSVTVLNFAKQNFSGTISPAFANLTSLRKLLLSENNLTGAIPQTLTTLHHLVLLDVSKNNLTGPVPVFKHSLKLTVIGNPNIEKNTSANDGKSNKPGASSGGIIAGIVIAVSVFVGVVLFVSHKCYIKKRTPRFGDVQSPEEGNGTANANVQYGISGYVGTKSELQIQSSGERPFFEVGNVVISVQVLRQVTDNFSENNILGRGGFGIVYRGELNDGTQMAVKRMKSGVKGTKGLKEFEAEIAVLTKVRHRHLVGFLGYCIDDTERLLVYEYMPQGTLSQHLFQYQKLGYPPLTWNQRVTIALDVARGVEYLHTLAQSSFIHRDLKPSNILLGNDMRAKVADFGLVKNAPDGKYSVETRVAGTFGYLAPEYAATGRVTTKVDVYAFGVVLIEIITGRKALDETMPDEDERTDLVTWFRGVVINKENIQEALDQTLEPDEETFDSICRMAELAVHCTSRGPLQRPDMGSAVNVLCPLVEQWVPSCLEEEDSYGIDLHPQGLQSWQSDECTSMMEDISADTHSSTSSKNNQHSQRLDLMD